MQNIKTILYEGLSFPVTDQSTYCMRCIMEERMCCVIKRKYISQNAKASYL